MSLLLLVFSIVTCFVRFIAGISDASMFSAGSAACVPSAAMAAALSAQRGLGSFFARRASVRSSAAEMAAAATASIWLTRRPVFPRYSESALSPSIQARPRPYQSTYVRKYCPSKRRFCFLDRMCSVTNPARFHRDSYKNVGWT